MTCQNCGHPKDFHVGFLGHIPCEHNGFCESRCQAYREPEPAGHLICNCPDCDRPDHEPLTPVPAVTDLPDAVAAAEKAWGPAYDIERARYEDGNRSWISEGRQFKDGFIPGFLAGFAAAHGDVSVNKGQSDAALAAASGPWAEQLDAANAERDELAEKVGRLLEVSRELCAERDAARAEVDELRTLNIAIDAHRDRLCAELQAVAGGALVEEAETSVRRIHAEVERDVARQALTSADAMNRHWDEINAHRDLLVAERDAALARNAELERSLAAFRKSNEDWRATTGEAIAEQEAAQREARSWESNYNALKAENAQLRSRVTEGLVCPTCKRDFADDARAELDNLRDRVTALADEWDEKARMATDQANIMSGDRRQPYLTDAEKYRRRATELRAAIVRGSDDE